MGGTADILAIQEGVTDAVHTALWKADVEIARLRDQLALADERATKLNRDRTDRQYMIEALVPMLGAKAREVWRLWQAQGVVRQHTSWTIDPMAMEGERVAQFHLDMEDAVKSAIPIGCVDDALTDNTPDRGTHGPR